MILFEGVGFRYPGSAQPVFTDFTEMIRDNEFVTLTGENGCGKTTLIRMLLRELVPDRGRLHVDGQELMKLKRGDIPFYRRKVGVIFQDFRLIQDSTVFENLAAAIVATGGDRRGADQKISRILSMLGISRLHKRYPRELSGGEQQKVCLARAVVNHPKLLLADEPTGNLDPESTAELNALLTLINRQGTTVVMATHDLEAAELPGRRRIDLTSGADHTV